MLSTIHLAGGSTRVFVIYIHCWMVDSRLPVFLVLSVDWLNIVYLSIMLQRNVGILEKIAQSLQQQSSASSSNQNNATRVELEQQYKVQLDVLRQLEQRVRTQLQTSKKQSNGGSQHTALVKLERDFERVQTTAQACRAKVTKLQKQQQQRSAAAVAANQQSAATNAFQEEQHKFQLQLQEDVRIFVVVSCVESVLFMACVYAYPYHQCLNGMSNMFSFRVC
jgi:hypothetical protein